LWFSRGGWNSVGSSEVVFILWCSEEVSAIRIAYLIARCNGRPNSSLHVNSCCNNVTVEVLLLIRSGYLFECCSINLVLLGIGGGVTSAFTGSVGLVQSDLKKVIAYLACSQYTSLVTNQYITHQKKESCLTYHTAPRQVPWIRNAKKYL